MLNEDAPLLSPMPSIQKTLPFLAYPAIGLLIGWGWVSVESGPARKVEPHTEAGLQARDVNKKARPAMDREQLLGEALRFRKKLEVYHQNPLRGVIDEWSDEEILAALQETLSPADAKHRHGRIAAVLLSELARRNPERAIEWVQKLPAIDRTKYTGSLIDGWVPERLDEAFVIAKKNPDLFGRALPYKLAIASLEEALKESPQAYVKQLAQLSKEKFTPSTVYKVSGVPEGFDYAAVLDSPEFKAFDSNNAKNALIQDWAMTDREAAFRWLMEQKDQEPDLHGLLNIQNRSDSPSTAEVLGYVKWLCGKLEEFTPEQKASFAATSFELTERDGLLWIEAAQDPELKDAFRTKMSGMVIFNDYNYIDIGFSALETFPDMESRLEALETQIRRRTNDHSVKSDEEPIRDLIRGYLSKWGVDAQRSESLVNRIRGDIPVSDSGK